MPSAASLVTHRLVEQREALTRAEAAVRAGEPEGVHDLRVAMRRLRSALATFRPVLDQMVTEPLRDELRWASGRLGEARDAEVAAEHAERLLASAHPAGVDEDIAGLQARLLLDAAAAADVVDETLDSPRYAAVIAALAAVAAEPPLTDQAERDAGSMARKGVRNEARRVSERAAAAWPAEVADDPDPDPDLDDADLDLDVDPDHAARVHDVRKAAKRLRYAAESVAPVTGKRMRRIVERATAVQEVLGEHHDAVVTRASLRHLAVDVDSGAAAAFLLGHLDAEEQRLAARLERRAAKALARLDKAVAKAVAKSLD